MASQSFSLASVETGPLFSLSFSLTILAWLIADITTRTQQGWVLFNEAIYLFNERKLWWSAAREFCEDLQSVLTSVENEAEQIFLESEVKAAKQDFWIGLYWRNGWKWADSREYEIKHWAANMPLDSADNRCGFLQNQCRVPTKCWGNLQCGEEKRFICKKRPDKRWYS
ncbi:rheacalcin-2-like [Sceloporus undulatus]|uniref:rheacalcin-2-like n=1 Tax=Sceloporus undulatus TaxID=8520 RepID=UPI001C4D472C|nr:rheacalcin-2-like [Sceloporus undulatus]